MAGGKTFKRDQKRRKEMARRLKQEEKNRKRQARKEEGKRPLDEFGNEIEVEETPTEGENVDGEGAEAPPLEEPEVQKADAG